MFSRLRSFLTAWIRREPFEDALDEEVRFHLEACTEELVRAGVPRREAARRARVQFGGMEGVKDDCRRARGLRLADELEQVMANVRFGLRMLFRTPVVTGVAVLSLALGIGPNAAIFSVFHQLLLRPLPVVEPERLVNLEAPPPKPGSTTVGPAGGYDEIFSYPMFRDLQRGQDVFTDIAAHRDFGVHVGYGSRTMEGRGLLVSGSYFPVLGLAPAAGRLPGPEVDAPIVNESFVRMLDLGRDVVGRRMGQGGRGTELDTEIVGVVADAGYDDVKSRGQPLHYLPSRQRAGLGSLTFCVRTALPPDGFLRTIPALMAELDPNLPVTRLTTLPRQVRDNVSGDRMLSLLSLSFAGLATLLAATGLYGVLACAVAQRTREIGLRMALGADAARLRAMVLGQVGRMTLAGGALGLVAALGVARVAQSMLYEVEGLPAGVVAAAVLSLAAVALGAGLVPAHRASRVDPMEALRHR